MAELLSMPQNLRTPETSALIAAWQSSDITAFCKAYERRALSKDMRDLLTRAENGDWQAAESLWRKFLDRATDFKKDLGPITDPDVERMLAEARAADDEHIQEMTANLYNFLEKQVNDYIETKLLGTTKSQYEEWDELVQNIGGAAERIWRDTFLDDETGTLSDVTEISRLLMLLWLEARLYRERCLYNSVARGLREDTSARESVGRLVAREIGSYREVIQGWDRELVKSAVQPPAHARTSSYFSDRRLQLQQLRRLIRQFSEPSPRELGWASQGENVKDELRYQLRDEIRRERLASGHWLASVGLFILKFTTGYGTRPRRFAITALVLFLADGAMFFLNDYFNAWLNQTKTICAAGQPQIHQWTAVLSLVFHYAYLSVTTLTTLGADTNLVAYCHGTYTQVLLTLSTITGYFMLALLSALLYTQLTQRD